MRIDFPDEPWFEAQLTMASSAVAIFGVVSLLSVDYLSDTCLV